MAAADDDIRDPAGHIDFAIGADPPDVAAAQPALVERCTFLSVVEIAGKGLRPAGENLAAGRGAPMDGAIGEHGDLDQSDGQADRAGGLRAIMRRRSDRAGELGHAVDLPHQIAGPCAKKAPFYLGRADRGAGGEKAQV